MAKQNTGYVKDFLGKGMLIELPKIKNKTDVLTFAGGKNILDYIHYSVVMSKSRRLAYYTAVNIDGKHWQDNTRAGTWKGEPRIKPEEQLGKELYSAKKSDFDRGHLVKREDPEWGDPATAKRAGENTFIFTNCAPQHKKLNQQIWQELENNILHTGAVGEDFLINVFTGPVLSNKDSEFVTPVKGQTIRIPNLFWKVVVWKKSDGKLYAVGFIMSQEKFLLEDGIIKKPVRFMLGKPQRDEDVFEHLEFKEGNTYQVPIEKIEELTGLSFDWPKVNRPFKKKPPQKIEADPSLRLPMRAGKNMPKRVPAVMLKGLQLG
jgi:endonuclease G, mitochondrial